VGEAGEMALDDASPTNGTSKRHTAACFINPLADGFLRCPLIASPLQPHQVGIS